MTICEECEPVAPVRSVVICYVIARGIMSNRHPVRVSSICFALCVALSGRPVTVVSQGRLLDLEIGPSRFKPTPCAVTDADQHYTCVNYHSVLSGVSFEHTCAVSAHANVAFTLNLGWWACHPSIQTNSDYDMAKKYMGFKYRQITKNPAKRTIQNRAACTHVLEHGCRHFLTFIHKSPQSALFFFLLAEPIFYTNPIKFSVDSTQSSVQLFFFFPPSFRCTHSALS